MLNFDEIVCPECGEIAYADFVDIGVGMQQCGPFGCESCGWVQTPSDKIYDLKKLDRGGKQ